ncbi:MAG: hypothetical protein HY243_04105 [Proteobacteria bacterium]|nr:hypothetical protein [Pseudomonadota bacterium]
MSAALRMSPANDPRSEIIHVLNNKTGDFIESRAPDFLVGMQGRKFRIALPLDPLRRSVSAFRAPRRLLRTDKANALFVEDAKAVVILYLGNMYRWSPEMASPVRTGTLRQSRNALHQGVAILNETDIFFGEYCANPGRTSVPVWGSRDAGRSWNVVHEFPAGSIMHIHGVYADPFSDALWIPTGDFKNECYLYRADRDFKNVERFGDGTQVWRTVALLFERERISWVMDTQLERSRLVHMDRATGALEQGREFPGPGWYVKTLEDGVSLLQTTCEPGAGVATTYAHLYASRDNDTWSEIARFEKDGLPMPYFKFGALGFADGPQSSQRFALFGEALRGFDGRASICSLEWN